MAMNQQFSHVGSSSGSSRQQQQQQHQQQQHQQPQQQQQQQQQQPQAQVYDITGIGHYGASSQMAQNSGSNGLYTASGPFANVSHGLSGHYRNILISYWKQVIHDLETEEHDYKMHQLPLARIKKVMKADPEVKMISAEAPILFAKGCDIFITELTMRAWIHAEENKRRTLQRSDIASALTKSDMFDFLIDIVPREEASGPRRAVHPPQGVPQNTVQPQQTMPPVPPAATQQQQPQTQGLGQPGLDYATGLRHGLAGEEADTTAGTGYPSRSLYGMPGGQTTGFPAQNMYDGLDPYYGMQHQPMYHVPERSHLQGEGTADESGHFRGDGDGDPDADAEGDRDYEVN